METEIEKKPKGEEEILAIDNDQKRISDLNSQEKNNKEQGLKEPPSSSIEFDKHQLFFHSQPNIMAYDTVTIKNTGKTCIYYQWQKNSSSFHFPHLKQRQRIQRCRSSRLCSCQDRSQTIPLACQPCHS